MSAQQGSSLPLAKRMLLLGIFVCLSLTLSTDGVRAQAVDDHGNYLNSATNLSLGSSVAGRIDPGDDVDVFKLDLSEQSGTTAVWIYTTGDLDTFGVLYDSGGNPFLFNDDSRIAGRWYNFHLRADLAPGIYYVGVSSFDETTAGDYILHAEAVTGPGSTISTATRLNLNAPTPGTIDTAGDADYFRLDLTETTNLYLYARSIYGEPVYGFLFDSRGNYVDVNHYLWDDSFLIRDDFGPGTYYIRVSTSEEVTSDPVPYTIHAYKEVDYPAFLQDCEAQTRALNDPQINDPLYGCQWHLNNRDGEDINVEPVWADGIKGEGVNVAVVDDGMYFTHEDLRDNVDASRNHDFTGGGNIYDPLEHHGTNVAGIIAARDNGIGVRGVAPRATIYGYNFLAESTAVNTANAMALNRDVTAVSNNSWGPPSGPGLGSVSSFWEQAVNAGVATGYGGKGVFYAFAGGNDHGEGGDSNLNEVANYHGVTAVCAVNDQDARSDYSEMGANLWVCAPSSGGAEYRGIVTTENSDRYVYDFGGTSASTPIVSGVAALLRQANPALTWRDLKLILAASARKNDAGNSGWEDGARKHGSDSAEDRYHFNHEYGFGVVDAGAAVDLARGWTNAPPLQSSTTWSSEQSVGIPDAPIIGNPTQVTQTLTLATGITFTEFVEVNVSFQHVSFRDLEIELESPSGAVSKLAVPFDTFSDDDPSTGFVRLHGAFRFGSARHLGEDPNGVWKMRVTDHIWVVDGTLDSWGIKVYGHTAAPTTTSLCASGGAVTDASNNPGLVSDCAVLLEGRDTLGGTSGSLNWSASTPMVDWDGVTVDGTSKRVTEVSLRNKGLTGTIPTHLGSLSALTRLDLITPTCDGGPCPDVNDHELNRLTGPIPASLGNLSSLQELSLHNNRLTGEIPPALDRLSNLQVLSLGLNQLTGTIPNELGSLTSLQVLSLWGNQLTGPIPTELGSLSNLEVLVLGLNRLTGTMPSALGDLVKLQRLVLWGNQFTGPIPTELGSLANLEVLSLSSNQLTGTISAELGSLSNLQELSLFQNRLTGEIPTELSNLSNLEVLYLSQNQLDGTIPAELGSLINLRELSLWDNRLSGEIPPELGHLTNLTVLYLSRNMLTGCVPAAWQPIADNDFAELGLPFCSGNAIPVFSDGAGKVITETDRSVAENTAAGQNVGAPVEATDADAGDTLTYSLGGQDAASFDINPATGQLMTRAALDFETKTSYRVVVKATDPSAASVTITVTITVTDEGTGSAVGDRFDANHNERVDREEVTTAIGALLFGGTPAVSREEVIELIGLFLFS